MARNNVSIDDLDIKILNFLSRNCRTSYDRLGSETGLTAKSIKSRIRKMQSYGVIHNFVVKLNLRVLDYSVFCLLIVRFDKPDDDRNIVYTLNLAGDIIGRLDGLGNLSAFLVAVKKGFEEKLELLLKGLERNLVQNYNIVFPSISEKPTNTDFKIMKCLFSNPRMQVVDIAKKISMSSKTVTRRLEKMIENKILEFSVLCNLAVMSGYIISIILASVEKKYYRTVIERAYDNFIDSFLLRTPFLGQEDVVIFILCSKDTKTLDSFTRKLESYPKIKKVDIFITTNIEYNQDLIIKEIDRKLEKSHLDNN